MDWTDKRVSTLIRLWTEGKSATVVAREMNEMFDLKLTRNAIIGKVHRLIDAGVMLLREKDAAQRAKIQKTKGVKKTRSAHYQKQKKKIEGQAGLAKADAPAKVAPINFGGNVIMFPIRSSVVGPTTLENVNGCLYAIGADGRGRHLFCNSEKKEGSAYCAEHHAKCHIKQTKPILFGKKKTWRAF